MELELYAPIPEGYELVALRPWLAKEDFVNVDGVVENLDFPGRVGDIRQRERACRVQEGGVVMFVLQCACGKHVETAKLTVKCSCGRVIVIQWRKS